MLSIRPALLDDIAAMAEIYNDAVLNTTATFDTDTRNALKMLDWYAQHDAKHPVIVAETKGEVAGWASLSRWSDKRAYDSTAEVSVYVKKEFRSMGIGKKLIEVITLEGKKAGLHNLLARITQGNEVSIHLFESFGYTLFGTMKEAGTKFGKYHDVHFLQKIFDEKS